MMASTLAFSPSKLQTRCSLLCRTSHSLPSSHTILSHWSWRLLWPRSCQLTVPTPPKERTFQFRLSSQEITSRRPSLPSRVNQFSKVSLSWFPSIRLRSRSASMVEISMLSHRTVTSPYPSFANWMHSTTILPKGPSATQSPHGASFPRLNQTRRKYHSPFRKPISSLTQLTRRPLGLYRTEKVLVLWNRLHCRYSWILCLLSKARNIQHCNFEQAGNYITYLRLSVLGIQRKNPQLIRTMHFEQYSIGVWVHGCDEWKRAERGIPNGHQQRADDNSCLDTNTCAAPRGHHALGNWNDGLLMEAALSKDTDQNAGQIQCRHLPCRCFSICYSRLIRRRGLHKRTRSSRNRSRHIHYHNRCTFKQRHYHGVQGICKHLGVAVVTDLTSSVNNPGPYKTSDLNTVTAVATQNFATENKAGGVVAYALFTDGKKMILTESTGLTVSA
eukprot:31904_6